MSSQISRGASVAGDRRNASLVTSSVFPNELYLTIVEHAINSEEMDDLERKCVLARFTLVSKTFRSLAIVYLFRSICYVGTAQGRSAISQTTWSQKLLNDEEKTCAIGRSYVQSCTFAKWNVASQPGEVPTSLRRSITADFLNMHFQALSKLSSLRAIHMEKTSLTAAAYRAILSLDRLTTLTIKRCRVDEVPDADLEVLKSAVRLTHFEFTDGREGHLDILMQPCISKVVLTPSLRTFKIDDENYARNSIFFQTDESFSIQELGIPFDAAIGRRLARFLDNTPSVTEISITKIAMPLQEALNPPNDGWLPLKPSSLPRLRVVQAPSFLLQNLLTGRTVDTVDMCVYPAHASLDIGPSTRPDLDFDGLLRALKGLTAPIHTFRMPASVGYFYMFPYPNVRSVGELDTLIWCTNDSRQWPHPGFNSYRLNIHHLEIEFHVGCHPSIIYADLRSHHQRISTTYNMYYPSATTVTIVHPPSDSKMLWRRFSNPNAEKASSEEQYSWRPVALDKGRTKVWLKEASRHVEYIRDFDGCFRSLFLEEEMSQEMKWLFA